MDKEDIIINFGNKLLIPSILYAFSDNNILINNIHMKPNAPKETFKNTIFSKKKIIFFVPTNWLIPGFYKKDKIILILHIRKRTHSKYI